MLFITSAITLVIHCCTVLLFTALCRDFLFLLSISAWLQFRLSDGSFLTNSFPPDTPLETIQQYIITVSS